MSIQPKDSSGGGGETREAVVQRLADDMLDKLPENYIAHEVSRKAVVRYQFLNELIVSVKLRNVTSVFSDAGRKKQTNKKKKQEKLYCSLFLHRIGAFLFRVSNFVSCVHMANVSLDLLLLLLALSFAVG